MESTPASDDPRPRLLAVADSYVGSLHWGNAGSMSGGAYIAGNPIAEGQTYPEMTPSLWEKLEKQGKLVASADKVTGAQLASLRGMYGKLSPDADPDKALWSRGTYHPSAFFTWIQSNRRLYRAVAAQELAQGDPDEAMNCVAFVQWCLYRARLVSRSSLKKIRDTESGYQRWLPPDRPRIEQTNPRPGDVVVVQRCDEPNSHVHVCIFAGQGGSSARPLVIELDGNSRQCQVRRGMLADWTPAMEVALVPLPQLLEHLRRWWV
jgi:hypothetical protein